MYKIFASPSLSIASARRWSHFWGRLRAPLCALPLLACTGIPRVNIESDQPLVTSEEGGSVEVAISLSRRPLGVITVMATSSNEAEAVSSEAVSFDEDNWDEPQIIRINGQDDASDDGDVAFDVRFYATSSRLPDRPPLLVRVLQFVNRDDEVARFQALGDLPGGPFASYVSGVDRAGIVVVGWSAGPVGDEAVRWTPETGLEGLGGANSRALAVSPNGALISGVVDEPAYHTRRGAALWQRDGSFEVLRSAAVSPDNPTYAFSLVAGNAVLDDGRVFVSCYQYGVYWAIGCRYEGPGRVNPFPTEPFAADDGNNYAGRKNGHRYDPFVYLSYDGNNLPYASNACLGLPWACTGEARAFSAAGAQVVGTSRVPAPDVDPNDPPTELFDTAWSYTQADGTQRLSDLEGGDEASGAYAVSSDGRVIAGFGSDEQGQSAVLWLAGVPTPLAELLQEQGGALPDDFRLREVRGMSADLRTFVGNGTNASGDAEGFRVVLASPP